MKISLFTVLTVAVVAAAQNDHHLRRELTKGNGQGQGNGQDLGWKGPKDVAKANFGKGSEASFVEVEPGLVIVDVGLLDEEDVAEFKEKKEKKDKDTQGNNRDLKEKEKDNAVKLYKRLTGRSNVPKDLEEAQARADAVAAVAESEGNVVEESLPGEDDIVDPEIDNEGGRKLRISDWNWINSRCTNDFPPDHCRCDTSRTTQSNGLVYGFTYNAEDIDVYFYPYRGSANHKVQYKKCTENCLRCCIFDYCWKCFCSTTCAYKDWVSRYSAQYQTTYIGSSNGRTFDWRFYVYNAAGDGWHYSVTADDTDSATYGDRTFTCPNIY